MPRRLPGDIRNTGGGPGDLNAITVHNDETPGAKPSHDRRRTLRPDTRRPARKSARIAVHPSVGSCDDGPITEQAA
jgi:hypothetical protein